MAALAISAAVSLFPDDDTDARRMYLLDSFKKGKSIPGNELDASDPDWSTLIP